MKAVDIDTMSWVDHAADCTEHLKTGGDKLMAAARTNEHAVSRAAIPSDPRPHIDVMSAIKTATPAWVSSATSDGATAQQEIRMYHPWSSLTDGGLYIYMYIVNFVTIFSAGLYYFLNIRF